AQSCSFFWLSFFPDSLLPGSSPPGLELASLGPSRLPLPPPHRGAGATDDLALARRAAGPTPTADRDGRENTRSRRPSLAPPGPGDLEPGPQRLGHAPALGDAAPGRVRRVPVEDLSHAAHPEVGQ